MASRITKAVLELGEERFLEAMEEIPTAERRDVFKPLGVPKGGAGASARQRSARRIRAAWHRLVQDPDDEAAEAFARHWLARNRMEMIRQFLEALEVEHEEGFIRDPEALDKIPGERVLAGLKDLMKSHDPQDVRLYAAVMELPEIP
jgi:hypothetical protein